MHRFSPDRLTQDQLNELAQRYEQGESVESLREGTGYTWAGLHNALKRHGVKFRGRRGPSPRKVRPDDPRAIEAFRLRDSGMGYVEAAKQVGLASITLRRLLIETGRDPQARWKGEGAPNWNGGRHRTGEGYIRVKVDSLTEPMGGSRGTVLEHRFVMAHSLGRPLSSLETVHHKNGQRDDNRIENLELRSGTHGKGQKFCCGDCGSRNIVSLDL